MPTVRGVPLKRTAFEGEGWKAAATDAKQMCKNLIKRRGATLGVKTGTHFPLPYPEGVYPRKIHYPDLTVPYNWDLVPYNWFGANLVPIKKSVPYNRHSTVPN